VIPVEQPINPIDYERGLDALNSVVEDWQNDDINLWLEETAVLPLVTGQAKYLLGPDGDDAGTDLLNTSLTVAAASGETGLSVGSTASMVASPDILGVDPATTPGEWTATNNAALSSGLTITNAGGDGGAHYTLETTAGMTYRVRFSFILGTSPSCVVSVLNGSTVAESVIMTATGTDELVITASSQSIVFFAKNSSVTTGHTSIIDSLNYVSEAGGSRVGIELTDGTRDWGYVLNVDSVTDFTLSNGIASAAASGLSVYFYNTKIDRPMRILSCQYADTITSSEIPTRRWDRTRYLDQPDKTSSGTVVNWYYSPTLDNGELYVWQVASDVNAVLRISYVRPTYEYSAITDVLDFPSGWYKAVESAIASELGPEYGVKTERQLVLDSKAAGALERALGHDNENDGIYLQPESR